MRFDLTDLRLFLAVADAGSITHGAADAGLSLPAASERLRDMERTGGVRLLERGRQRFDIFCAPCHGPVGDGDGMIVRRGFPHPPSYHGARLRAAPASHFLDVITHGHGVMYSYAARVAPADRWAIIAYIRALQLSRGGVALAAVPEARERLP